MASKRVARSAIDWAKLEKLVPKPEVHEFQLFKAKSNKYSAAITSLPENLPAIDWNQYKRRTVGFNALVEQYEKQYKSLSVPYPKAPAEHMDKISQQEKQEVESQKKFSVAASDQVKQWESELQRWTHMPPVAHMTRGELIEYFPDLYLDYRKQPSLYPHTAEVNDPAYLAKFKNYNVPEAEGH